MPTVIFIERFRLDFCRRCLRRFPKSDYSREGLCERCCTDTSTNNITTSH